MSEREQPDKKNVVDLFSKEELKKFFLKFLIIICVLEVLIFFISYLSTLEPYPSSFPWRAYFYAAFIIPIGITFLLGIIIIAFNTYLSIDGGGHFDALKSSPDDNKSQALSKTMLFLNMSSQFQFVLFLLALGLGGLMMFHMDDFMGLLANAGENAFHAILIFTGVVLIGAISMGLVYFWMNYKLRKKQMEYAYQYKRELMSRTGMIMIDDSRIIDSNEKVVSLTGDSDHSFSMKADSDENVSMLNQKIEKHRKSQ